MTVQAVSGMPLLLCDNVPGNHAIFKSAVKPTNKPQDILISTTETSGNTESEKISEATLSPSELRTRHKISDQESNIDESVIEEVATKSLAVTDESNALPHPRDCVNDRVKYPMRIRPEDCVQHSAEKRPISTFLQYCYLCLGHILAFVAMYTTSYYWTPQMLLVHVFFAYTYEQCFFVASHLIFHANFANRFGTFMTRPDEFAYIQYVAWYHHYVDIRKFTTSWLEYRVGYMDFWSGGKQYFHNLALPFATFLLMYQLLAYGECTSTFLIDVELCYMWRHVQAHTHEYYHIPLSKRAGYYYFAPFGWIMRFFCFIGLLNDGEHKEHHADDRIALTLADKFYDTWVPAFIDKATTKLFRLRVKQANPVELIGTPWLTKDDNERPEKEEEKFSLINLVYKDIMNIVYVSNVFHGLVFLGLQMLM